MKGDNEASQQATNPREEHVLRDLFNSGVEDVRAATAERLYVPQIRWDRLAAGAFDSDGAVLATTANFPAIDPDQVVAAVAAKLPVLTGAGEDRRQNLILFAPRRAAQTWRLPGSIEDIANTENAVIVGLSAARIRSEAAVHEVCESLGLSPLQAALIAALVRHGDLARAAQESNVAYSTARESIAEAMARVGASKRATLIERVVSLAFGILPSGADGRTFLRDAWGLTPRQATLAVAIAHGATRAEAARSAGASEAVAKKDLANVFVTLGVVNATELSALLSEAAALATLMEVTRGSLAVSSDHREPLRLVRRPRGEGLIAFSDYGPQDGSPVLILHSSSASRPAPTRLVRALQRRGFRPFAIDRPGFGLTDAIEPSGDPFADACADVRTVCGRLGINKIDLVARGGAQVAMHLAAQSPDLLARVVLVAPDPPSRISRPTAGVLGAVKRAFQSNPALIEPLTRLFVGNLTNVEIRELVFRTVRSSPPDLAVMRDALNLADYCRGFQMFMSGRVQGYVREQAALVVQADPPANLAAHWRVLIGAHDPLHHPHETSAYWRTLLPHARIEILPDAGRFIVMSHADLVADSLVNATPAPTRGR